MDMYEEDKVRNLYWIYPTRVQLPGGEGPQPPRRHEESHRTQSQIKGKFEWLTCISNQNKKTTFIFISCINDPKY